MTDALVTPTAATGTEQPFEQPTPARSMWASISAVVVKETRWRMRGRRAFVILTVYVLLLALLVFAVQRNIEQASLWNLEAGMPPSGFASGSMSAAIGQAIFSLMVAMQTLLTLLLAPALTSGAISMEREKQTLELLVTTPISTLGMVIGKLISSLAYVVLLILASIPMMSLVFAFGGIAPDDVARAYVLLFAIAFGTGALGLFMSALTKRTQIATALSYVVVFMMTIGSLILHTYLLASSVVIERGTIEQRAPSEIILWLNPIVAGIDLGCTAIPDSYGGTCSYIGVVTGQEFDPVRPPRDVFWPRSVAAFVLLGVGLTLASTQLIAPSRRLRRGRPPPLAGTADDEEVVEQ